MNNRISPDQVEGKATIGSKVEYSQYGKYNKRPRTAYIEISFVSVFSAALYNATTDNPIRQRMHKNRSGIA